MHFWCSTAALLLIFLYCSRCVCVGATTLYSTPLAPLSTMLTVSSTRNIRLDLQQQQRTLVDNDLYYAPTVDIRSKSDGNDLMLNWTRDSLIKEGEIRFKRKLHQQLKSSFSSLSPSSSSSSVPVSEPELQMTTNEGNFYPGSSSPASDAVFLGSIHKESYERIINASFVNLGSTPSPGQVSATDPYIDPATPSRITAYTGITAILPCFVNNLRQRSVSWVRHRDIHVLTVGRFTFTNDDRFFSHHEDGSNEWALRLRSPKEDDSGYYECQVNTKPLITRLIFLQVLEPHAIIAGGRELYLKLGSTIELNCKVLNTPSKSDFLLWYHNEKVMNYEKGRVSINISEGGNATGSVLRITFATGRDSGTYTCSPSNARNSSVNVHVINGEHPAAMQTNCGKIVLSHFSFLTLALFIMPFLMDEMPDVAILTITYKNVPNERS